MTEYVKTNKLRLSLILGFAFLTVISCFENTGKDENLFFLPDFVVEMPAETDGDDKVKIVEIDENAETCFYFAEIFRIFF